MKKVGLATAALIAVITLACGGGREEANSENRDGTIGTGGETTDNTATTADTRGPGAAGDVERWVNDIAMHNMAEIELGKLAGERASNAQVKQYGQMMVKDHTMAGNELKQAVGTQVQVQEQMDQKHRDLAEKLRGMQGMEFDREYLNAMVDGHEEVKGMLEDRAREANNTGATANSGTTTSTTTTDTVQLEAAVNQWAARTLPKVEQHLQQAEQLRDRVRNTTQNNTDRTARPGAGSGQ